MAAHRPKRGRVHKLYLRNAIIKELKHAKFYGLTVKQLMAELAARHGLIVSRAQVRRMCKQLMDGPIDGIKHKFMECPWVQWLFTIKPDNW